MAVICSVEGDRVELRAQVGLDPEGVQPDEVQQALSLCRRTIQGDSRLVLDDVRSGSGGLRAYAGIPLVSRSGIRVGCASVMDRAPRRWGGEELDLLNGLAGAALSEIELRVELAARRAAEAEKEATARFLRSTLESLDGAVFVVDKEGRGILECNRAAETVFGYARSALMGSPTRLLHVDDDHHERFGIVSTAALRKGGTFRGDFQMRRADGTTFPTRHVVTLLEPERGLDSPVVSIVYDVTAEAEAKRRLAASEERFRQIAESIADVFWIYSPLEDRMEYVSPAYSEVWGLDERELLEDPRAWTRVIHEGDRDRVLEALPRRAEGAYEEEYRIVRPDGDLIWILDRTFPLRRSGGEVYRIIGVAKDVTERRRLQEQLQQSQKLEAVGRLAGGVAHDFNNLLTVMRGHAELALDTLPSGLEAETDVQRIAEAAEHGTRLVRQLLAFGRKQLLQEKVIDLRTTVGELGGMLRRLVRREVALHFDVEGERLPVRGDPTQIAQVVLNLVVNASDAIRGRGRITVRIRPERLSEEEALDLPWRALPGRYGLLEVEDTGEGMAPDVVEQIFEPFFTTKDEGDGTGLGLSMVYGIVKQSKGHIFVESRRGRGSTFRVLFPRDQTENS